MNRQIILVLLPTLASFYAHVASAVIITQWTMESPNTPGDVTGQNGPSVAPAAGTGTLTGFHTSTSTAWSTPVGNGSAESLSSNNWALGDYYQFSTATTLYEDIMVCLDHTSSSTGPRDFTLAYSTGGPYTNHGTYMVKTNTAPIAWNSTTRHPDHELLRPQCRVRAR